LYAKSIKALDELNVSFKENIMNKMLLIPLFASLLFVTPSWSKAQEKAAPAKEQKTAVKKNEHKCHCKQGCKCLHCRREHHHEHKHCTCSKKA
jgi:hypothetical protein